MAAGLGAGPGLPRRARRAGRRAARPARAAEGVRARDAPVSLWRDPHRSRQELHDGRRRRALPPPQRRRRLPPDGVRRVRPAGRERGHRHRRAAGRGHRPQHRPHPRADEAPGHLGRLGDASWPPATPSTTAGRSGSSCACSSAGWPTGARRPSTGARSTRPCWPTSRSSTATASAAAPRSSRAQLAQWFFRITEYAERLLDDMDELIDWPERVLTQQRNWIGRSEGAERGLPGRGTATRRSPSSPRAPTRSSARRSSCSRPSTRGRALVARARAEADAVLDYASAAARETAAERADRRRRRRPASSPGARRSTR